MSRLLYLLGLFDYLLLVLAPYFLCHSEIVDVEQVFVLASLVSLHQLHLPLVFGHVDAHLSAGVLLPLGQCLASLLLLALEGVELIIRARLSAHVALAISA